MGSFNQLLAICCKLLALGLFLLTYTYLLPKIGISGFEIVKLDHAPFVEYRKPGAMISNIGCIVRDYDHRAIAAITKQLLIAALMETRIPNGADLVNKEAIKLDDHRNRKSQPCSHPG